MTYALPSPTPAGRSWWFVIDGSPPSKNDQRAVSIGGGAPCRMCGRRGGSNSIIKGERTKAWEAAAFVQLAEQVRALGLQPITGDVRLSGVAYWRTRASDMELSRIQDVLQGKIIRGKRGSGRRHVGLVIADDKQVMEYGNWFRRFDSKRPRVELLVEEIGPIQERLL